ncbi:unnamed protein product [Rotaria socialis]|uniref:ubiquitinyl hydrolase 1 n=4 Tax=Rotaria socialis TaxID=392032 RepID=A0A820HV88_9BILA|nr:unnamed protein product [Rotaria socialis]CAF3751951.1 unnamed protein product [Rotaria socialis]CAF4302205.1 unnamed protein product [Rotaria socialis]CAF4669107.1 unnamed protein product [Rotaria socialis]
MTVLSTKKPSNNNKDSTSNQQPQQQSSTATRLRLSCDDEKSNGINSNDDSNETNVGSSCVSSTVTDNTHSMTTTTSPILFNKPKRKSHYHQHHHNLHQTINKQARRKCTTIEENLTTNNSLSDDSCIENVSSSITTNDNQIFDEDEQYNSEDEYEEKARKYDRNNLNETEIHFARTLKEKKGYIIKPVQDDGACLFRAIADQVFGNEDMHSVVRQNCMDYIVKNADFFRAYITEDFDQYVTRKRRQNCHGNHIEMIALSELYNRPIEVYEYSTEPINIVHGMYKTDNEPIRLSYHCGVHYNSIIDPWRPTAGHGLGLPDLEPGRAQESLIHTALRQSEESHIEQTMLDDKLAATDWEATQDELIQQIARESYLQWLCDTNQKSTDSNTTSSATTSDTTSHTDEINASKNLLPLRLEERKDCEFALPFQYEGSASSNIDLDDEDSLMRQVLAMSQIEYMEQFKKQETSISNDPNEPSSSETHLL